MCSEYIRILDAPIGRLAIHSDGEVIHALHFHAEGDRKDDLPLLLQAERELAEYFAGRRRAFSVPLCIRGTPFQMKVWQALTEIPYGETISYSELARRVGSPKGARAAGAACGKNPLPVFIPCHRVISSGGALTGFAGGLEIKKILLKTEDMHVEI